MKTIEEEIQRFLDKDGKLKQFPSKRKMKIYCMFYLAKFFQKGKIYTEKEINEILNENTTFCDPCTLRRELFDNKFLDRKSDCSAYWLEKNQPKLSDYFLE